MADTNSLISVLLGEDLQRQAALANLAYQMSPGYTEGQKIPTVNNPNNPWGRAAIGDQANDVADPRLVPNTMYYDPDHNVDPSAYLNRKIGVGI